MASAPWVQRGLEIISEAVRHVPQGLLDRHPDVPWREIKDIGNVLRHAYHAIDNSVIWRVVIDDLPPLRIAIEDLLRDRAS